ncbi:MAG TPA: NADH-quinone oxidoreductase subunit L, partial [Actinoplanes sp.]
MSVDVLGPLLPAVPLIAGLLGLLLSPGDGGTARRLIAAALGIAGAAAALIVVVWLLLALPRPFETSVDWVQVGDLTVTYGVSI